MVKVSSLLHHHRNLSFHPYIVFCFQSSIGSWWQKVQQSILDVPLLSNIFQLIPEDPKPDGLCNPSSKFLVGPGSPTRKPAKVGDPGGILADTQTTSADQFPFIWPLEFVALFFSLPKAHGLRLGLKCWSTGESSASHSGSAPTSQQ